MIIAKDITPQSDQVYERAVARLVRELGWAPAEAHTAMGEFAQGYGVFLDDVAEAVLHARSVKRGLARALRSAKFDRRPMEQRVTPAR
ncbi:MAG TPA: hypothetical protein VI547_01800 [Anaerolineales bacterium]|nr:hypothetical protein [Anaerolineales bacterium]